MTKKNAVEFWLLERLVPYGRNPRKHEGAVDRMVASLQEFGFKIPVLACSSGEVVDGHLRLKAARKLGLTEIPVILCDEWTPAQIKGFRLLANRSVNWAEWDEGLLALELGDLQELDFNLALTGFEPGEVQDFLTSLDAQPLALTEEDALPPVPPQPLSQIGDVWLMGPHRVVCGDATQRSHVRPGLSSVLPGLVRKSPPRSKGQCWAVCLLFG